MKRYGWVFIVASIVGLSAVAQQLPDHYLTGNLENLGGTVVTEKGEQRATFSGSIGLRVVQGARGLLLYLVDLDLISKGVLTERGASGTIGLQLADGGRKSMNYDARSGLASTDARMVLHYGLIDRVRGFQQIEAKGEMDIFPSYTEEMAGRVSVRFPGALKVQESGRVSVELDLTFELSSSVLGSIRRVTLIAKVVIDWTKLFQPAEVLRIQPVFIGTGPSDPSATGTAWDDLMKRAHELWSRCGSVRCIRFLVNAPVYLNKPAYKILETETEAGNLRAEIDVVDAVEVFVVDRMNFACSWGGGACFSSGTASAKIVTCDQQLAIPSPCPCPGYCPATCPPCPPCQTGAVNDYHLAHELGHALDLAHPPGPTASLAASTVGSNMEPSGFCCDNPNVQSAKNCRNASNPLLFWGTGLCFGTPDIMD